jgi:hypothetical protein
MSGRYFIMDETKKKDLLFQFLESIYENDTDYSSIKKMEKNLFEKLNSVSKEKTINSFEFETLTDLIHELCCEIKYRYFIYGSLAGNIINDFPL